MVRYGNYRVSKRYLYRSYTKTFTDLTTTALHYILDKEKFLHAAKLMLSGKTLEIYALKFAMLCQISEDHHEVIGKGAMVRAIRLVIRAKKDILELSSKSNKIP